MLPVIAEIVRSGFVEGHHYGSAVALDAVGEVTYERGDVRTPILPRSCNKPLQAVGMLRAGLDLEASCSPSPAPPTPARSSTSPACAGSSPAPASTSRRCRRRRTGPSTTTCATRSSGRAATATPAAHELLGQARRDARDLRGATAGPPRPTWTPTTPCSRRSRRPSPSSPVSRSRTSRWTAAEHRCSPPPWSGSRARSRRLATGSRARGAAVATAIRAHPELVSGSTRDERALLRAVPGAIAKAGAESCYARRPPRRACVRRQDRRRRAPGPARGDGRPAAARLGVDTEAGRGHRRGPRVPARRRCSVAAAVVGEIRAGALSRTLRVRAGSRPEEVERART